MAVGKTEQARALLADLARLAAKDGGYWMGWQFEEGVIWPYERASWTAGALVLAADAIQVLSTGFTLVIRNCRLLIQFDRSHRPTLPHMRAASSHHQPP